MADASFTGTLPAGKMYWRGKPLEDHTKEELIEIIKCQARQHASAGETINQLTDLIGHKVRGWR